MGLKFDKSIKEKKEPNSPQNEDDEGINIEATNEDKQKDSSFLLFIKKNIRAILITVVIVFLLILLLSLVGEELKSYLKEKIYEYKDLTPKGFIFLTLIGTIMVVIGAPILFFELSLGCVLNVYIFAVLIAAISKLMGIFISYQITQNLLKKRMLSKFGDNLYLRILRKMSRDQPAKALAMLGLIQIPMIIKNYSLPLFEVGLQYIVFVFCMIQIVQSVLFCFVGSTLSPTPTGNVDAQGSVVKDILTYLSYAITIISFYLIYKETQKIKKLSENNQYDDDFDYESNLKSIEMQQKITYMKTQELQKTHEIKLVYPKINQED